MKISELTQYLNTIQKEHGDIEVVCVGTGCSHSWETTTPAPEHNIVWDNDHLAPSFLQPDTKKYLYLGVLA